jgi:hypothetical protein
VVCGKKVGIAGLLYHGELNFDGPGLRTRATEVLEQHEVRSTSPRSRATQHFKRYTSR